MCDDLIAHHYRHTAPQHTLHPSPAPGVTHFTLLPTAKTWVVASEAVDLELLETLKPRWNTINSYDPRIAAWAQERGHTVDALSEMKLDLSVVDAAPGNLSPPPSPEIVASDLQAPQSPDSDAPASPSSESTASTASTAATSIPPSDKSSPTFFSVAPPAGFKLAQTLSTKSWFLKTYPHLSSILHSGGEQVFSVVDVSGSIPKRAGWITVLPDEATKRVYISALKVEESYRRRGLGRWLVGVVVRGFKTRWGGSGEVWLTVFDENEGAAKMYEGAGFEKERELWVARRKKEKVMGDGEFGDGCD